MLHSMGNTAKRREQIAEILAEGDAIPPAQIPASHVELVNERLARFDRGETKALESAEVWAYLRAQSKARARPARKKVTPKRRSGKAPRRRTR